MPKVLQFKVNFTADQEKKLQAWFIGLKKFWNYVLYQIDLLDTYYKWDKESKTFVPKPAESRYRKLEDGTKVPFSQILAPQSYWIQKQCVEVKNVTTLEKFKQSNPHEVVYTLLKSASDIDLGKIRGWKGGWSYSCPVDFRQEPLIRSYSLMDSKAGLALLNKGDTITNCSFLCDKDIYSSKGVLIKNNDQATILSIPFKYRQGTLESLDTAWQEHLKTRSGKAKLDRGKPKYKRYQDKITTLIHPNPNAGTSKPASADPVRLLGDNWLNIPGLGKVRLKGLDKRWRNPDGSNPRVKVFKIVQKKSGYYIQLTGDIERSSKLIKKATTITGIDPGLKGSNWINTDTGSITVPRWYRESEEKLAKLQQELDRKRNARLILWLGHPGVTETTIRVTAPAIPNNAAQLLKQCKSIEQLNKLISDGEVSNGAVARLRYNAKFPDNPDNEKFIDEEKPLCESNEILKLKGRIAKLQEKNKLHRQANNQKISTWLVRKYPKIYAEDGLQNTKGKAKAKYSDDGSQALKNQQVQTAGRNKSLADTGLGSLYSQIDTKAKAWGRKFQRIKTFEAASSQQCPVCGQINQQMKDISESPSFTCTNCNWHHQDRDQKAAIYYSILAYDLGEATLNELSPPAQSAIAYRNARNISCKLHLKSKEPSNPDGTKVTKKTRKKKSAP